MVRRLYKYFQPEHYNLLLDPDRDNLIFSGKVAIIGRKVSRPSQRLTFHQKGLKVLSAEVIYHDKKGDKSIEVTRINHHRRFDEVRIHTEQMLYPGKYTIHLEFEGTITKPMHGIYPCFFDYKGKTETLIATQFESHHAREAFPCVDEPEAKATFDLSLKTPKDIVAISNTPVLHQKISGKQMTTRFDVTPRMSPYLLAFVFGNLAHKEAETKTGVIVRTYTTPDNIEYSKFALEVGVKCLEFYDDYFGIHYPLPKCDMVALPDFASGAMENWGCITYREQTMLVDPKNTSLPLKQHVAMVVAHELAHQWFGNLVTMSWWTDLWLNEGFASWIEHLAIDHLYPKWQLWTQFVLEETTRALSLDALKNSHPIEVEIQHPNEITSIFDTISYSKGSSVIHMLNTYLGSEIFRKGLKKYLTKFAYSNAQTKDLWEVLESVTDKSVTSFMTEWTSRTGFPLVTAEIGEGALLLGQERFLLNPIHRKDNNPNPWPIPLLDNKEGVPELFDKPQITVPIEDHHIVKLNQGQKGFYRVSYNSDHLEKLAELVHLGHMDPIDRFGLLSDTFETAKAGYINTKDALNLLANYADEDNVIVWTIIASNLSAIKSVMSSDSLREAIKPFVSKIIFKQFKRLGWEEIAHESHFDRLLRPTIIGLAASADEPEVLKEINKLFDEIKNGDEIAPDLRGVVYTTIARHGGSKEFNKLLKLYKNTSNSEERVTLAAALTSFRHSALIIKALDFIDSDEVRLQDALYWLAYSFSNRYAKVAAWEWMTTHWKWLESNLGDDLSFYRLPVYAAMNFSDRSFLPTYKKFFKKVSTPSLERSVNQGIEVIEWQSAWRKRDFKEIKDFFESN